METSVAVLLCFSAIVTGVISTSLWEGKITGANQNTNTNNPGLLGVRPNPRRLKISHKLPKIGCACLLSKTYAVTSASLIKEYEDKEDFDGLFVSRGTSSYDIDGLWSHDQYNPENQFSCDIGIIKLKTPVKDRFTVFPFTFAPPLSHYNQFTFFGYESSRNALVTEELAVFLETTTTRSDNPTFVKPCTGTISLDSNDVGGPALKKGVLIGVISKFNPGDGLYACTMFTNELIKDFMEKRLPQNVLQTVVALGESSSESNKKKQKV